MSIMTEQQAREILEKVVKLSTADECVAGLGGGTTGNIRFALNQVSTSGVVDNANLAVTVAYGKKTGTATTNAFDDAALARVVKAAEDLAKLAPENPEFMPAIEKQEYKATNTFEKNTAAVDPAFRAQVAADCIEPCRKDKLVAAGFFTNAHGFSAIANSNGNFGYQQTTQADFTCTVRTDDGRGSGWVARNTGDVAQFDAKTEIQTAISKAKGSVEDERVEMWADPWDPQATVLPWDDEGLKREKVKIIDKGKVAYLQYSRYWAKEKGKVAQGQPGNIIMAGGDKDTMALVKGTERGILVTRTWYIRMVDPQTVLLTGLTRDGTFYIEDGEIKYPIKNMRFNESPVIMLNNVEELGKPVRLSDDESPFVMVVPPMKLRDFTFTSLSDAV